MYPDKRLQCQHYQRFLRSERKCYTYQFGTKIWREKYDAKLVSVTLSLRPEEALLVLTSRKLVWIHV